MPDLNLALTAEERDCLAELLQMAVKDARIEEHRTRAPAFREHVLQREHVLEKILTKLGQPPK